MGMSEEYQKVIELLEQLRDKVRQGRIRFTELGEDLIAELVEFGFEMKHSEEKKSYTDLVQDYVAEYKRIVQNGNRQAETAYLENMACAMRERAVLAYRQEEELIKQIKNVQKCILPVQLGGVEEDVKHIQMDVRELFMQQNVSITELDYQRLDVVVKYLAIENYYNKNDYGFALHQKLQSLRQRQSENMPEGYEKLSSEAFKDLIRSVEKEGFWESAEITCDSRLFLLDGAHRLAVCLYFNVPNVRVKVVDQEINVLPFTLDYLRKGGFTEEEIRIIREKAEELMNAKKVNLSCILWPPVAKYFDRMTGEIANACRVVSYQDYTYSEETFARVVRGVYHIDDTADWKVNKKLEAMRGCPEKKVRVLQLEILYPLFRLKELNNHTISVIGERLKTIIRNNYKGLVDNYIYDIIVNTGDNYIQSEYMEKLFSPVLSMERYLKEIEEFDYFLIKHETPYLPADFPKTYAFSKDIDIICVPEQYEELVQKTLLFVEKAVDGYEVRCLKKEEGVLIRIELNGYLMLQLDIGMNIPGMSTIFCRNALARRQEKDGYYVPQIVDELCIRANEYRNNPRKIHHLEYMRKYKEYMDWSLLEICMDAGEIYRKELEALI